jgi:hypothetical protein
MDACVSAIRTSQTDRQSNRECFIGRGAGVAEQRGGGARLKYAPRTLRRYDSSKKRQRKSQLRVPRIGEGRERYCGLIAP